MGGGQIPKSGELANIFDLIFSEKKERVRILKNNAFHRCFHVHPESDDVIRAIKWLSLREQFHAEATGVRDAARVLGHGTMWRDVLVRPRSILPERFPAARHDGGARVDAIAEIAGGAVVTAFYGPSGASWGIYLSPDGHNLGGARSDLASASVKSRNGFSPPSSGPR